MLNAKDTICAIATGNTGAIAIVRLSGEKAVETLKKCFFPKTKKKERFTHGRMMYGFVRDANGDTIDEAMAVCFYAPFSYTREDVCEIQLHGGRMCAQAVMGVLTSMGVRAAEPGEFTRRAFLNGRMDLSEAEAVMGIIGSRSQAAMRASVRQLRGGVSARIGKAREALTGLIAMISAATDFPDEIDEDVTAQGVKEGAEEIRSMLLSQSDGRRARMVREGASVVLCGLPNVGKSSVMNALLSVERAIVTDIPGTTRDVLTESMELNGVRISLSDTAGLRETEDKVEKIGVERAMDALKSADCVLFILDASRGITEKEKEMLRGADDRYVLVFNKTDICGARADVESPLARVLVSAKTGDGMNELADKILEKTRIDEIDEDLMTLPRHIECAARAIQALSGAIDGIDSGVPLDFAAADLREALSALGDITGDNMSEDVIDRVFQDFCVGK